MSSTVDVRTLPHLNRHTTVIEALDALELGNSFTVISDQETIGLQDELATSRPGEVAIVDSEREPGVWETTIERVARVLDVRPIIDAGDEPFETIMATVGDLGEEDLVIVAPFEPTPLEGVLSSQGFAFEAHEVEPDHWRTRFSLDG